MTEQRVVIVGAGVAGLTASIFTARAGLDTLVLDGGESILRRNAHIENFPGFPAGVNSRTLLDLLERQAGRNGATVHDGAVEAIESTESDAGRRFVVQTREAAKTPQAEREAVDEGVDEDVEFVCDFVVAASKSNPDYLDGLDVERLQRGSKEYVAVDQFGRTRVENLYAAGRLAERYHQAIVAAGDGATVGLTVIEDSDVPFYHDWVAPEGYFTGRGRDVPPGCEEIDAAERERRERESLKIIQEAFEEPHPDEPTQHPSVGDE